jgi:hypothetical protein
LVAKELNFKSATEFLNEKRKPKSARKMAKSAAAMAHMVRIL